MAASTAHDSTRILEAGAIPDGLKAAAPPPRVCSNDWAGRDQTFRLEGVNGISQLATSKDRGWRNCFASLQGIQAGSRIFEPCENVALSFCWDTRLGLTRTSSTMRRYGVLRFGSFNVIPPGERVEAEVETKFQSLVIYLARSQLDEVAGMFGEALDLDIDLNNGFNLTDPFVLASAQGIHASLVQGSAADDRYAELHALTLAERLVHIFSRKGPAEKHQGTLQPRIRSEFAEIPAYIDKHLHEPITVQDLSRLTSIRPRQFSRIFQNDFGVSPYHYVMKARIDRAQQLISSTDRTIADICLTCGFGDQSYFTKIFRKYVGCNPTDLRT